MIPALERINRLKAIRREFQSKQSDLEAQMYDHLSTFLSGGFQSLSDEELANAVDPLARWLCENYSESLAIKRIKAMLLMDQWGVDLPRLQRVVKLTDQQFQEMVERLQSDRLIQQGRLIHPWYDHSGRQLKCQILIYLCVVEGTLQINKD